MHMRMLPVLVAHDDVLRIGDFHLAHILLRKLYHLLVRQLGRIVYRIAQRDMSDWLAQTGIHGGLCAEAADDVLPAFRQYSVRMEQDRLLLAQHVVHTALKPASFPYFSNHPTNGL